MDIVKVVAIERKRVQTKLNSLYAKKDAVSLQLLELASDIRIDPREVVKLVTELRDINKQIGTLIGDL